MIPQKSNGASAANAVPAEINTINASDFIAGSSTSPVNLTISTKDKLDGGMPLVPIINWTEFPDARAIVLTSRSGTWADLIERIRSVGTF